MGVEIVIGYIRDKEKPLCFNCIPSVKTQDYKPIYSEYADWSKTITCSTCKGNLLDIAEKKIGAGTY